MLEKAIGCENLGRSAIDFFLGYKTLDGSKVVNMGVLIDDSFHRLRFAILLIEVICSFFRLERCERIDNNDAGGPFDNSGIGQVKTSHLIYTISDLEETVAGAKLGLTP